MALLPAGGNPYGNAIRLNMPGIPGQINLKYFFDKAVVRNALSKTKHQGLVKAGLVVMQIARRRITQKGMARPKLKVMNENPGTSIRDLIGMSEATGNKKQANKLRERLLQIQAKEASQPGDSPHTHTGVFRNGITFQYDTISESVVIGQFMNGGAWLASLHEFGGQEQMRAWAWVPRWQRSYRQGILGWWRVGREPRKKDRWAPTGLYEAKPYPERPYMRPAINDAIDSGRIAEEFRNKFRVGGM